MAELTGKKVTCVHKCHVVGLNPWVRVCPVCGCPNENYNPESESPDWLKEYIRVGD